MIIIVIVIMCTYIHKNQLFSEIILYLSYNLFSALVQEHKKELTGKGLNLNPGLVIDTDSRHTDSSSNNSRRSSRDNNSANNGTLIAGGSNGTIQPVSPSSLSSTLLLSTSLTRQIPSSSTAATAVASGSGGGGGGGRTGAGALTASPTANDSTTLSDRAFSMSTGVLDGLGDTGGVGGTRTAIIMHSASSSPFSSQQAEKLIFSGGRTDAQTDSTIDGREDVLAHPLCTDGGPRETAMTTIKTTSTAATTTKKRKNKKKRLRNRPSSSAHDLKQPPVVNTQTFQLEPVPENKIKPPPRSGAVPITLTSILSYVLTLGGHLSFGRMSISAPVVPGVQPSTALSPPYDMNKIEEVDSVDDSDAFHDRSDHIDHVGQGQSYWIPAQLKKQHLENAPKEGSMSTKNTESNRTTNTRASLLQPRKASLNTPPQSFVSRAGVLTRALTSPASVWREYDESERIGKQSRIEVNRAQNTLVGSEDDSGSSNRC